jgi:hypothetical protein
LANLGKKIPKEFSEPAQFARAVRLGRPAEVAARGVVSPSDLVLGTDALTPEVATGADRPSRFDRAGGDVTHRFMKPIPSLPLFVNSPG